MASTAALFPRTVGDIKALGEAAKAAATKALEQLYGSATNDFAFARQADITMANFAAATGILSVGKNVYPDKEMRDVAASTMVDLQAFSTDHFSSNPRLYAMFKAFKASPAASPALLGEERGYWLDDSIKQYTRQGMDLDEAAQAEVRDIQKQLSALFSKFQSNISNDATVVECSIGQLDGVPANVISGLKTRTTSDEAAGLMMHLCGLDYPTYFGIMKNCTVADTRKRMSEAFDRRAFPQNIEILQQVIALRHKMATRLGYPSFSHFDLEMKMVKDPSVAKEFIQNLIPGLQKKWQKEKEMLLADKPASVELTAEGDIQSYDVAFLMNEYKKRHLNVDERRISEYFPLDATVQALFKIYESFFAIRFEKSPALASGVFWDDSVSVLAVIDDHPPSPHRGQLLGHIVLDLFPRAGKFSHACCHGVLPAMWNDPHVATYAQWIAAAAPPPSASAAPILPSLAVVLANFPAPSADGKPALFMHDDVETFFHEFGHAIHGLMGRAAMATHAGTRVKTDFVELPSQMLEEWLWETSVLTSITRHHETAQPLSAELIDSKIRSKNAFSGRDNLRQLQLATYSIDLYSRDFAVDQTSGEARPPEALDTTQRLQAMLPTVMRGIAYSPNSRFQCSFGHLMGYGAAYYGYMWSEVLAQDVFECIRAADGLLSPVMGRRYVDLIIGRGGGRDPSVMLEEFLGRKPNSDAFIQKLGL